MSAALAFLFLLALGPAVHLVWTCRHTDREHERRRGW